MALNRLGEGRKVADLASHYRQASILKMMCEVPLPAGKEVIVQRNCFDPFRFEQVIREMTPDKPSPAYNKNSTMNQPSSLHPRSRES